MGLSGFVPRTMTPRIQYPWCMEDQPGVVVDEVCDPRELQELMRAGDQEAVLAALDRMGTTDEVLTFSRLPAGVYKGAAHNAGFLPAIVLVTRTTASAFQELQLELFPNEDGTSVTGATAFWQIRKRIPRDVLREIQIALADQERSILLEHVNERTANIGARRLHTVLEKLLAVITHYHHQGVFQLALPVQLSQHASDLVVDLENVGVVQRQLGTKSIHGAGRIVAGGGRGNARVRRRQGAGEIVFVSARYSERNQCESCEVSHGLTFVCVA